MRLLLKAALPNWAGEDVERILAEATIDSTGSGGGRARKQLVDYTQLIEQNRFSGRQPNLAGISEAGGGSSGAGAGRRRDPRQLGAVRVVDPEPLRLVQCACYRERITLKDVFNRIDQVG